jgi:hypothetical protein
MLIITGQLPVFLGLSAPHAGADDSLPGLLGVPVNPCAGGEVPAEPLAAASVEGQCRLDGDNRQTFGE